MQETYMSLYFFVENNKVHKVKDTFLRSWVSKVLKVCYIPSLLENVTLKKPLPTKVQVSNM